MPDAPQQVGGKILVVHDYPANVKLLERSLQAAGYETLAACDGQEALLKVQSDRPDLILLDAVLPKIDGFEVCRRLRADEATAVIPIIMVTALKDTEDRIRGLEAGADDFLSRPFDRGELLARVKGLLQVKYYRSMLAEREKFHAVIQDLSHGIVITDGQWRVQTISRRAAELLRVSDEGQVGRNLADLLARFQVEPSLDALRRSATRSVSVELSQEDARPPRYLAGRYTRIEGPRGELYNAALVFRDITEMRRKEKLKSDFLSLFSHKLKHPLTSVMVRLDMMNSGHYGPVPQAMADALRIAVSKIRELSDLIEKVLAYAALTATELERAGQLVEVRDLVDRTRERIAQRYPGRPVEWQVALDAALPHARAPEELLSIVLDNLLDNAVKFSPPDQARVRVSAREVRDRYLEVSVRDSGPGIRTQDRDQVFTDFTQLEDSFTGNITGIGLGLATAKRLVESWGGLIDFESAPQEGSRFFFTVPSEFSPPAGENRSA
ncbi:MAG: response regulator [Planctomycetes bacterium]|nr:response regulator [Planctomycetota bacterium]